MFTRLFLTSVSNSANVGDLTLKILYYFSLVIHQNPIAAAGDRRGHRDTRDKIQQFESRQLQR